MRFRIGVKNWGGRVIAIFLSTHPHPLGVAVKTFGGAKAFSILKA